MIGDLLLPSNAPNELTNPLWSTENLIGFIQSILILTGLPGVYLCQAPSAGWLGLVGYVLTFFGELLFASLAFLFTAVDPFLATNAPELIVGPLPPALFASLMVASLTFGVGAILLGIVTMRTEVLPRWAGLLLVVAGVTNIINIAPLPPIITNIIGNISIVLHAAGFAWIGYALMLKLRVEATESSLTTK